MLRVCSARRRHQDSASAWSNIPCVSVTLGHIPTWCKAAPLAGGPGCSLETQTWAEQQRFPALPGHLAAWGLPQSSLGLRVFRGVARLWGRDRRRRVSGSSCSGSHTQSSWFILLQCPR